MINIIGFISDGPPARSCELDSRVHMQKGVRMESRNGLLVEVHEDEARRLRVKDFAKKQEAESACTRSEARWLPVGDFAKK
ncbi:hypothetical protein ACLB2K_077408 [Fragaria x ananassa]